MKFLKESFDKLIDKLSGNEFLLIDNPYQIKNLINNKNYMYNTLLYDLNLNYYMIGKNLYHYSMLESSFDAGYYIGIDPNINNVEDYYSLCLDNELLYFIRFKKYNDLTLDYISSLMDDGYDMCYIYNDIYIFVREKDVAISFKNCDLYKILGKPNSILTTELLDRYKEDNNEL